MAAVPSVPRSFYCRPLAAHCDGTGTRTLVTPCPALSMTSRSHSLTLHAGLGNTGCDVWCGPMEVNGCCVAKLTQRLLSCAGEQTRTSLTWLGPSVINRPFGLDCDSKKGNSTREQLNWGSLNKPCVLDVSCHQTPKCATSYLTANSLVRLQEPSKFHLLTKNRVFPFISC